ncbi:ribonuclease H-like domain-containing protein [Tanacetum coccineum]
MRTGSKKGGLYVFYEGYLLFVFSGKSPYELVYKSEPSLLHLKTFGCLCFSTVLNESDKFGSRYDNCVFVGYAFDKKGYKLFSLDQRKFLFFKDVKFYETVFPFKYSSFTKEFVFKENRITDLTIFDSSHESNEVYDDGGDYADIGNEFAPDKSTNEPRVSTIDSVAKNKDNTQFKTPVLVSDSMIDSDSVDVTGSTSSRKDTKKETYATETSVSEGIQEYATEIPISVGIQSTSLNDDDYESEG